VEVIENKRENLQQENAEGRKEQVLRCVSPSKPAVRRKAEVIDGEGLRGARGAKECEIG